MNYIEWSRKLYEHFFNNDNLNQEVVLHTDEFLLNQLFEDAGGLEDFLKIFNPKNILAQCDPRPSIRISTRNPITLKNEFNSIEHLLKYLEDQPTARFKIDNQLSKCSDPLSYFPFIILVIYAYGSEGVFNEPHEQEILGREINIRKYTFNLLIKLSNNLNPNYIINIHNIYGIIEGPNRYTGVFRYHSLFSRTQIFQIQEIIRRHRISRPIYNDIEIIVRFGVIGRINNQTIAPAKLLINKIIDGSIYVEKNVQTKNINNSVKSEIVLYPQLTLNDQNNVIQYFLRPSFQSSEIIPNSIFLKIKDQEIESIYQNGQWYKSISIINFDNLNIIESGTSIHNFINLDGMFFQQIGEVFEEFSSDNNFFIYTEKPVAGKKTVFWGSLKNRNKLKSLISNLEYREVDNYIVYNSIDRDIIFEGTTFKVITSNTIQLLLAFYGGYRITESGHEKIYPYFLLPKLNFNLDDNIHLRIRYQTKENDNFQSENININDNTLVFRNYNPEYGVYALDLNKFYQLKENEGTIIMNLIAELVDKNNDVLLDCKLTVIDEFKQSEVNENTLIQLADTTRIGAVTGTSQVSIEDFKEMCKNDYLTRIIATAVYSNKVVINEARIDAIISQTNFFKKIYFNEDEDDQTFQVIKNLRALGYIKVLQDGFNDNRLDYIYEPSDLALIQTNKSPQGYSSTFFLSGLRSFEFIEGLCNILQPMIDNCKVNLQVKEIDKSISKILPPEIYISFKQNNHIIEFLDAAIDFSAHNIAIRSLLKIVPYNSNALADLIRIDVLNLNGYLSITKLSDVITDIDNGSVIVVNGQNCNYSLIKAKNTNSVFIGKGSSKADYKQINTNLGFVIVYSSNQIPYIFSAHLGNVGIGSCKPIYINSEVRLPQDVYSKLVYLNGGLPTKHKIVIQSEVKYHYTPNSFDNIFMNPPNEEVVYYKFEIDLKQRKQLENILSTTVIYIQNAEFLNL
jgi:hypothetical protein